MRKEERIACLFILLFVICGCERLDWGDPKDLEPSSDYKELNDTTIVDGLRVGSQTYPFLPSDMTNVEDTFVSAQGYTFELKDIWVCGYIIGYVNGTRMNSVVFGTGNKETNIVLADGSERWDTNMLFPVQLSKSSVACDEVREMLNLSSHPENLLRRVKVRGSVESYMGVWGMKNTTQALFVE